MIESILQKANIENHIHSKTAIFISPARGKKKKCFIILLNIYLVSMHKYFSTFNKSYQNQIATTTTAITFCISSLNIDRNFAFLS